MKKITKSTANRETLGSRMKAYEEVTTNTVLVENLPIYARIDMRAGHSWCKGLNKPFDADYSSAMQIATKYIVEKTGAVLGYTQSDEASFVWLDHTKIPFETRLFKLQSVLASMFTSAFISECLNTKLASRFQHSFPSFDCRVCNMPSLDECANMILWRERDSIKNSITLLALCHYSTKQLHKVTGEQKIALLKEEKNIDYFSLPEHLRNGSYFRREVYNKEITAVDEIEKFKNTLQKDENGKFFVKRSHVVQFSLGHTLTGIANKKEVLFYKAAPILAIDKKGET